MEKENIVSIWLGKFDSQIEFEKFLAEEYNEDGDMTSHFGKSFNIDFIDNQFQEVIFLDQSSGTIQNLITSLSYSETFVHKFESVPIEKYNCIVALYNFEYVWSIEIAKIKPPLDFIGNFTYRS
ncbi:immunity 22 family protein [Chitinophaga flava]|uniref:Immunity protein 22 n=1 Tax=Chitinophaga flava TaxID=2259036 RepID=A0A365XVK1_9BACT|nr:immunity 22 family protein [Chitinophaga flava]RBL90041.1 hypothetical protein DF182_26585 [Chitinophaga flava]